MSTNGTGDASVFRVVIRQVLEGYHQDVAHSIGGVVGLELANILKERICGFVAVGASIPAANGSYISSFPFFTGMIFRLMIALAGTKPPESALRNGLCNDLTEEQTSKIINLFIPESKKLYTDRLSAQKPPHNSMYLRLKKDNAISESVQNNMIANLKTKQII